MFGLNVQTHNQVVSFQLGKLVLLSTIPLQLGEKTTPTQLPHYMF